MPPLPPDPAVPPAASALLALLQEAGEAALDHFSPEVRVERKADGSPVTAADRAAEAVLLAGIARLYPGESAEAEEGGRLVGHPAATRWVIDPLDGTSAFTEGLAHWGPSLARLDSREGESRVDTGATWLPRLGEFWWFGMRAQGRIEAWHAIVRAGLPSWQPVRGCSARRVLYAPSEFHTWPTRLAWTGKVRCLGGTAAHLALVARGSAGAAIVAPGWSPWEVAAGVGLIMGAGGSIWPIGAREPVPEHQAGPSAPARVVLPPDGTPFVAGHPEVVADVARSFAADPERFTAGEVDAT